MTLRYNGIQLEVVNTLAFNKVPMFSDDDTTYLYTRYEVEAECYYNPMATSYQAAGQGGALAFPTSNTPRPLSGMMGPVTEASLQHVLSQPRGQILFQMGSVPAAPGNPAPSGGAILLQSPLPGSFSPTGKPFVCDAKNGPFVERCSVKQVQGEKTFLVSIKLVTYLTLCQGSNPLISHRWRRYEEIDPDHFARIITEGEAIFRADLLIAMGTYPDQYRGELFHPVPKNCQREDVQVTASSDGTSVAYRYVDREKAFNLNPKYKATRVEAYQTGWFSQVGPAQAQGEYYEGFLRNFGTHPIGAVQSLTGAPIAIIAAQVPKFYLHFVVKVWGDRTSTRTMLTNLALTIISARSGGLAFSDAYKNEFIITHDVAGKFVELQLTLSWGQEAIGRIVAQQLAAVGGGPVGRFLLGGVVVNTFDAVRALFSSSTPNAIAGPPTLAANPPTAIMDFFLDHEDTGGANQPNAPSPLGGALSTANPAPWSDANTPPNPVLPNSKNTRGTWIGQLVAQVLSGNCATPPATPRAADTVDQFIYSR